MPEETRGARLLEYGVSTEPTLIKKKSLNLGYRTVGTLCRDSRTGSMVYATERDTEEHRYHGEDPWYDLSFDGDGYGLSIELFSRLHGAGVGAVYIVETDTGDVYHFAYQQFVDGDPINFEDEADERGWEKDPQMVVAVEEAVDVWFDAYPGAYGRQPAFD